LKEHFKNARILQGTSYAEGVDLSMYETLIIYSMDYSTAKYSQRKARQANMARVDDINVIYLLMKGAISDQVYTTVCENNKNYVDSYFINSTL
jgi:ERCC4-related helicase